MTIRPLALVPAIGLAIGLGDVTAIGQTGADTVEAHVAAARAAAGREYTEIAAPVKPMPTARRPPLSTAPHRPARPSADHPWRRDTRAIDRERALSRAAQP